MRIENDVEILAFIRRVQRLGFKLTEIRSLLKLRGNRLHPCALLRRRTAGNHLATLGLAVVERCARRTESRQR